MQVDLSVDRLVVDGQRLGTAAAQTLCHFAVHKPVGYICSNVSKQPGRRAIDLLQPWLDSWQQRHKVRSKQNWLAAGHVLAWQHGVACPCVQMPDNRCLLQSPTLSRLHAFQRPAYAV